MKKDQNVIVDKKESKEKQLENRLEQAEINLKEFLDSMKQMVNTFIELQ